MEVAWAVGLWVEGQGVNLEEDREVGLAGDQEVVQVEAYVASVPSGHLVYQGVLGKAEHLGVIRAKQNPSMVKAEQAHSV